MIQYHLKEGSPPYKTGVLSLRSCMPKDIHIIERGTILVSEFTMVSTIFETSEDIDLTLNILAPYQRGSLLYIFSGVSVSTHYSEFELKDCRFPTLKEIEGYINSIGV